VNAVGKAVAKMITEASIGAGRLKGLTMFSSSSGTRVCLSIMPTNTYRPMLMNMEDRFAIMPK